MTNSNDSNPGTATILILKALIPYSQQNLKLSFHPTQFFDDLERASNFSRTTLQQSYARLKKKDYVTNDNNPTLTTKGSRYVQPFVAKQLEGGGQLMVIFDIPEDFGDRRRQLRNLLRQLGFTQTQRSVWITSYDHVQIIRDAIKELNIGDWVELYEVSKVS